jgi:hypothetical protein
MTRASTSSTAQPARDLIAPCKEANPPGAQQAVAELREHRLLPC